MNPLSFCINVLIVNPSGVQARFRLSLKDLSPTPLNIPVSNREIAKQTTNSNANFFSKK